MGKKRQINKSTSKFISSWVNTKNFLYFFSTNSDQFRYGDYHAKTIRRSMAWGSQKKW